MKKNLLSKRLKFKILTLSLYIHTQKNFKSRIQFVRDKWKSWVFFFLKNNKNLNNTKQIAIQHVFPHKFVRRRKTAILNDRVEYIRNLLMTNMLLFL